MRSTFVAIIFYGLYLGTNIDDDNFKFKHFKHNFFYSYRIVPWLVISFNWGLVIPICLKYKTQVWF